MVNGSVIELQSEDITTPETTQVLETHSQILETTKQEKITEDDEGEETQVREVIFIIEMHPGAKFSCLLWQLYR